MKSLCKVKANTYEVCYLRVCSGTKSCPTLCNTMDWQARLPGPSPSPGVWPRSCPLNQWCHPTISSSVALFSFCFQSFPTSGSFPVSQLFSSGGQSIGASFSASVLTMSIQGWSPLGLTGSISLQSKGLSRVFSSTKILKHQFFSTLPSLRSNSYPYMTTGKIIALTIQTSVGKVMSLLFNMLFSFVKLFF